MRLKTRINHQRRGSNLRITNISCLEDHEEEIMLWWAKEDGRFLTVGKKHPQRPVQQIRTIFRRQVCLCQRRLSSEDFMNRNTEATLLHANR